MEIQKKIEINKSIDQVWKVLAVDFDKAGEWMSAVYHSEEIHEGDSCSGSPMVGRICELSPKRKGGLMANEKITLFDEKNHHLKVDVVPFNGKIPVNKNELDVKLVRKNDDLTEVIWSSNFDLKTAGKILKPVLKAGISKGFNEIMEELKFFVETGKPHPRKLEQLN